MIHPYSHFPKRRTRGFSLVELLVSLVIATFLMGGIFLTYTSGQTILVEGQRLSRTQENIRFASDFLVRELRNAGFRDELSLGIQLFNEFANEPEVGVVTPIDPGFALVSEDGTQLTIRMSGAHSCGNPSQAGVNGALVINTYSINDRGDLICDGRMRQLLADNSIASETFPTIRLATGIQVMTFEPLCTANPNGTINPNPCECRLWRWRDDDQPAERDILFHPNTCHGMLVNLTFAGSDNNDIAVQLRATFRNLVIRRLGWIPQPPEPEPDPT